MDWLLDNLSGVGPDCFHGAPCYPGVVAVGAGDVDPAFADFDLGAGGKRLGKMHGGVGGAGDGLVGDEYGLFCTGGAGLRVAESRSPNQAIRGRKARLRTRGERR